jgi:hypothetical protein
MTVPFISNARLSEEIAATSLNPLTGTGTSLSAPSAFSPQAKTLAGAASVEGVAKPSPKTPPEAAAAVDPATAIVNATRMMAKKAARIRLSLGPNLAPAADAPASRTIMRPLPAH